MKRQKGMILAASVLAAGMAMAATVTVNAPAGTSTNVTQVFSGATTVAVNTGATGGTPAQRPHGRHHARLRHARRAAGVAARRLAYAARRQLPLLRPGRRRVDDRDHELRAERGRVAELAHRQRPHDGGRHVVHGRPLRQDRPRHAHARRAVLPRRGDDQPRFARHAHRPERRPCAYDWHVRRDDRRGNGGRQYAL